MIVKQNKNKKRCGPRSWKICEDLLLHYLAYFYISLIVLYFLAPTGAQEMLMFVPDHRLLITRSPPSDV